MPRYDALDFMYLREPITIENFPRMKAHAEVGLRDMIQAMRVESIIVFTAETYDSSLPSLWALRIELQIVLGKN